MLISDRSCVADLTDREVSQMMTICGSRSTGGRTKTEGGGEEMRAKGDDFSGRLISPGRLCLHDKERHKLKMNT